MINSTQMVCCRRMIAFIVFALFPFSSATGWALQQSDSEQDDQVTSNKRFEQDVDSYELPVVQNDLKKQAGIEPAALDQLIELAEQTKSDALVVIADGKLICHRTFGKKASPIETMSCTKSIVSMAIGALVTDGKIKSLDTPVCDFYPEWKQGKKQNITLRHLLTHKSGLESRPTTELIYAAPDFVQFALAAELSAGPGEQFAYNNKAVNLLAGVVLKASGKPLDEYLQDRLFKPMGIETATWTRDKSGNPHGMAGCQLEALDFAKLGLLMLQNGQWDGEQLLSKVWVEQSVDGEPINDYRLDSHGLLWWVSHEWVSATIDEELFKQWKEDGVDNEFLEKMEPIVGETLGGPDGNHINQLMTRLVELYTPEGEEPDQSRENHPGIAAFFANTQKTKPFKIKFGPINSYSARGYLGQYLVVVPKLKLIAVRQRRYPQNEEELNSGEYGFRQFETLVSKLGQAPEED